jgi:hypothetical protein
VRNGLRARNRVKLAQTDQRSTPPVGVISMSKEAESPPTTIVR